MSLKKYLTDPFLRILYDEIKSAGSLKSISLDITHNCNLRCKGCYYFEEGMDDIQAPIENDFDALVKREKARGTNFITIVGGEPSLVIPRIKKLYTYFRLSVATNGLIRIPFDGLENLPIGISIWGKKETDSSLRANGKRDLFREAKLNYKNDPRAFWYYTVASGYAEEIESVVSACIQNGNKVLFNYYSDLADMGQGFSNVEGFSKVQAEINRMIKCYPDHILMTPYFNQVIASGSLMGEKWGYDVCTNLSTNYDPNFDRLANGKAYNQHFRAYNADFKSTRRCCTGIDRSCDTCFDTWEHFSWLMINLKKHSQTKMDFSNWLTSTYLFYYINRLVSDEAPGMGEIQHYLHTVGQRIEVETRP